MVLTVRDVGEVYLSWLDWFAEDERGPHYPFLVVAILTAALVVAKTLRGDQGWGG